MKKLIIRILLSVLAFTVVLPHIPGIDFHGNLWAALALSLVFGFMLWLVELIAVAFAALWTISTLGLAILWLIPLWVIGFWILPACAFMLTANILPQYLSVDGFLPAALAGLIMFFIGVLTTDKNRKTKSEQL